MKPFVFGAMIAVANGGKSCTKPAVVPYGELRCGNSEGPPEMMNDGDMCLLSCDEDAEILDAGGSGIGKINCNDGVIVSQGYCNCKECCSPIPTIDYGTVTCQNHPDGYPNKKKATCSIKCDYGYERDGAKETTCKKNNKQWSNDWPSCEKIVVETTVPPTTTEITTTTTSTTTTSTTSSTATTSFVVSTTQHVTTQTPRPDPGTVGLITDVDGTEINMKWNELTGGVTDLNVVYTDQHGLTKSISIPTGDTEYTLSGLRPGYRYEISLIVATRDGDLFSDSSDATIQSDGASGKQCIVCDSSEGNAACNALGRSCEARPDQVCQTVVRASNGLPARFEKRCKQKLACENERAILKLMGACGGGARQQNVDVCIHCCDGDFCNAEGEFSDVV